MVKLRILFTPVVKCHKHGVLCRLYAWRNDEERLYLNKSKGDIILNKLRWWIPSRYSQIPKNGLERKHFDKKYSMTDELLSNLAYEIIRNRKTATQWCKAKIHDYAEHAKQLWLNSNESYNDLDLNAMMKEINAFFDVNVIKGIINELAIGYLKPSNQHWEKYLFENHWIGEIHVDASHQTQDNIIVKVRIYINIYF